eukprot:13455145-Alexandrium_andersonii.AAC.1
MGKVAARAIAESSVGAFSPRVALRRASKLERIQMNTLLTWPALLGHLRPSVALALEVGPAGGP